MYFNSNGRLHAGVSRFAAPDGISLWTYLRSHPQCDASRNLRGCVGVDVSIVNLNDRPSYNNKLATKVLPTLCTTSAFYDLVRSRPLYPEELWLRTGYPHPKASTLLKGSALARFPIPSLVDHNEGESRHESIGVPSVKLTLDEERLLLGNAMHVSSVEAWVLYNMMFAPCKTETDYDPSRDQACASSHAN